jgi:putative sigma-54 modulation protein
MQISVSARHGQLNSGDQRVIEEKVGKLRRLFDRVNAIEVMVDLEHIATPIVEVMVSAEHSEDFVGKASAPTVLAALDLCIPKLEHQLRRAKEKMTEHRATSHKHLDIPTPQVEAE